MGSLRRCLLGLAWALLLAAPAHAGEEGDRSAIPDDALPLIGGMPPYYPRHPGDEDAVRTLCAEMVAVGRAQRGTRVGGDMLFTAAHAHYSLLHDKKVAFPLYEEAAAAYPADDPTRGVVLFHHARRESSRGNPEKANDLLAAFRPWIDARVPADLGRGDAGRWDALAKIVRLEFPRLQSDVHKANGRFEEAAEILVAQLEDDAVELTASGRRDLWERAARLRYRGGDRAGAIRAIEEGIKFAEHDHHRMQFLFWRLHARNNLISIQGGPVLTSQWPGKAYEEDARVFLRQIQGGRGVADYYMQIGSNAFTCGRLEFALEVYLLAMRDPAVVDEARKQPSTWRGLLVAYAVAAELGRFDEAEEILNMVERIADEPIEEIDQYRIAIREGRARQRAEAEKTKGEPDPAESEKKEPPSPGRKPLGRIETGPSDGPPPQGATAEAEEGGTPLWMWLACGLVALLGLIVLVRAR